jgi:hypothetical protein
MAFSSVPKFFLRTKIDPSAFPNTPGVVKQEFTVPGLRPEFGIILAWPNWSSTASFPLGGYVAAKNKLAVSFMQNGTSENLGSTEVIIIGV